MPKSNVTKLYFQRVHNLGGAALFFNQVGAHWDAAEMASQQQNMLGEHSRDPVTDISDNLMNSCPDPEVLRKKGLIEAAAISSHYRGEFRG